MIFQPFYQNSLKMSLIAPFCSWSATPTHDGICCCFLRLAPLMTACSYTLSFMGPVAVSFFLKPLRSLLHFTTGESPVVTGDYHLKISGSAIKLIS